MPQLYAHTEAAKKAAILPSASYYRRLGYDFEAKKDLVKGSSLPGRLFREYCITSLILASKIVESSGKALRHVDEASDTSIKAYRKRGVHN